MRRRTSAGKTSADNKDDTTAAKEKRPAVASTPKTLPMPSWSQTVLASTVMGSAFGLAFYKSHVYEPEMIRGQFLFAKFVMLKVFFGAMGTGALLLAALDAAGVPQFASARELWRPTGSTRGWLTGAALGGFFLGAGMAVSGACPGMVLVALGGGTSGSLLTVAGGLLGALAYGLCAEAIQANVLSKGPQGPCSKVYADEALGIRYSTLAAGLGVFCLLGCAALEYLVPWKSELPSRLADALAEPRCDFGTSSFSLRDCPAWPPSLGGILVGSLQLPAIMEIQTLIGSATAYQVCASCWMIPLPAEFRKSRKYLNAFATPNPKAWWQVFYAATAVVMARILSSKDDDRGGATGVEPWAAFLGGFVIIFASRLGGGCTSGHGLSGCAVLLVQSWIAVPAMFAGGIAVAVAWQSATGDFFVP